MRPGAIFVLALSFLPLCGISAEPSKLGGDDRYFIAEVSYNFGIPACTLAGVLLQEGGTVGKDQVHQYSVDIGLAQIRKGGAWTRYFLQEYGITEQDLRSNRYMAILAAGYILWRERESTGSLPEAIAAYHRGYANRLDERGLKYLSNVVKRMQLARDRALC